MNKKEENLSITATHPSLGEIVLKKEDSFEIPESEKNITVFKNIRFMGNFTVETTDEIESLLPFIKPSLEANDVIIVNGNLYIIK